MSIGPDNWWNWKGQSDKGDSCKSNKYNWILEVFKINIYISTKKGRRYAKKNLLTANPVNFDHLDFALLSFWNYVHAFKLRSGKCRSVSLPTPSSHIAVAPSPQNLELSVRKWHWIQSPHRMTAKQHDVLHHFFELIISFISGMFSFRVLIQRKQFCERKGVKSITRK